LHVLGTVTASAPFTHSDLDGRYEGDTYYQFEKTTATGHNGCIGMGTTNDDLVWLPCSAGFTYWVWSSTNYLVNVRQSDDSDEPAVAGVPSTSSCTSACDGSRINVAFLDAPYLGPWSLFTGNGG